MPVPGQGFEYPPVKVAWTKREALLFALSIGADETELNLVYELHPEFAIFPTYPSLFQFKGSSTEVVDFYAAQAQNEIPGIPRLNHARALDGERRIECLKTLPSASAGRNFELRSRVLGVYDKGRAGTVVETEYILIDAGSNEIYSRLFGSGVYVGQGGWGGPRKSSTPSTISLAVPQTGPPTAVYETKVPSTAAHLYRLNGDYNPLHATPEPGIAMGAGGIIMHGLYTWNMTAHLLIQKQAASKATALKDFQARMSAPVKPGDELVTEVWDVGTIHSGLRDLRFVVKRGSTDVLTNGRALIASPSSRL